MSLRLRDDPQIRLWGFSALGVEAPGLVIGDGARDDDVLALIPVGGRRDAMLGGELQRVDDAQYLLEVAPGGHRINQDQLDLLVRPDDEDVADGLVVGRG